MKKNMVRVLALTLVMVMVVAVLASCGGPSGTYGDKSALLGSGAQYKFSGSKVAITISVLGFEKTVEGTYKMGTAKDDDGKSYKTITFTFDGSDADAYEGTVSYEAGKDDTGAYISLGGVKYYKQK